jgi:hypothetical protein
MISAKLLFPQLLTGRDKTVATSSTCCPEWIETSINIINLLLSELCKFQVNPKTLLIQQKRNLQATIRRNWMMWSDRLCWRFLTYNVAHVVQLISTDSRYAFSLNHDFGKISKNRERIHDITGSSCEE